MITNRLQISVSPIWTEAQFGGLVVVSGDYVDPREDVIRYSFSTEISKHAQAQVIE